MVIGHTKLKTIKEQGMTEDQEFQVLESNLNADYANIVAHKADVIATINIEREVNENKRVTDTKRWVYFRSNGFINAGSRFSNIVDRVELSAGNFVKAIEDAIKASMSTPMSDVEIAMQREAEVIANEQKAMEFSSNHKAIDVETNTKLIAKISANIKSINLAEMKAIMSEYGIENFKDVENIKTECLERIAKLIG